MKPTTKAIVTVIVVLVASYMFYKHSGWFQWSHQPLQYMPNMHRTKALKPQRGYEFYPDFASSRVPPAGSVAREQNPYKFADPKFLAGDVDKFKSAAPRSKEVVMRGQYIYNNTCIVCHGPDGAGNGSVVGAFPNPPSLLADKIRDYADSQIYHVIVNGQNVMGSYAPQISEKDRWAVIHYIRVLQLADRPSDQDINAFDSITKESK